MTRRSLALGWTLLLGSTGVASARQGAPRVPAIPLPNMPSAVPADTLARGVVTSVTLGLVYLNVGRNDGVAEGTIVSIPRLGIAARYRVAFVSSRSASAKPDSAAPLPTVGDTVVFMRVADQVVAQVGASGGETAPSTRRGGRSLFRGRVGLHYLGSWDRDNGRTLTQPGVELLLEGQVGVGSPVGLSLDLRPRRTITSRPGDNPESTEILGLYQASLRFQALQSPVRAVVGRQFAPTLAGLGLFDGLLIELQHQTWGVGVMAGLAPDLGSMALSSEIRQVGAYVQRRGSRSSTTRWNLTFGGMGSYLGSDINREFAFLQANISARTFSMTLLQELDFNRGWKSEAGQSSVAPTSTFLSAYLAPSAGVALSGGFDSRRNVMLYRDHLTPEITFDDRFRRGYWADVNFTIAQIVRFGGGIRTRTIEGADSLGTTAYSVTMNINRVTPLGLGLRLRGTQYETPGHGRGLLAAGAIRVAPTAPVALEFNLGSRQEQDQPLADRFWMGVDGNLVLGRAWFAVATFTREWGRDGMTPKTDLVYAGLSYRF